MYTAVRTQDYPDYADSELDDRESLYYDTVSLAESEAAAVAAAAAAAAAAIQRRTLSQSRNTVYHSAVDLAVVGEDQNTPARRIPPEIYIEPPRPDYAYLNGTKGGGGWHLTPHRYPAGPSYLETNGYCQNSMSGNLGLLDMSAGAAIGAYSTDYWNAQVLAAQVTALQQGSSSSGYGQISWQNQMKPDEVVLPTLVQEMPPLNASSANQGSAELLKSSLKKSVTTANEAIRKTKKMPITYSQWKFRTRRRFQDGVRSVDFVLSFPGDDENPANVQRRQIYESNLLKEGLELELDNTQRIHFVKIHAPLNVLYGYAEILKIKLPLRKIPGQDNKYEPASEIGDSLSRVFMRIFGKDPAKFNYFYKLPNKAIYDEFKCKYVHLIAKNPFRYNTELENFIDAATRNYIINFILERQRFVDGEEVPDNLGFENLISDGVYDSAYPLHDDTDRDVLIRDWASLYNWKNPQPLDKIKEYFGTKVALYFAWMGFYSYMLIPLSILIIVYCLYGLLTWGLDDLSKQICQNEKPVIMCPRCDTNCPLWSLSDNCFLVKMKHLIDNNFTIAFSILLSIWAVVYLELWKQYSTSLMYRWGLTGYIEYGEHPRSQYLSKIRRHHNLASKMNKGQFIEPYVSFWRIRFLPNITSYSIVLLYILISVISLGSLIVYRMIQGASYKVFGNGNSHFYEIIVFPATIAFLNLLIITILGRIYSSLAIKLTNLEYCRTQTEYEQSLTIKNVVFQLINYYTPLIYIAFIKGKFIGYPGKYNRFWSFRLEECRTSSCLVELCLHLVIMMVGKPIMNSIIDMLFPCIWKLIHKYIKRRRLRQGIGVPKLLVACNQWTEDYHLQRWSCNSLFMEYLEMVIQYGFVTLFSLVFPLAPLLSLINNIFHLRLNAIKMLKQQQRPIAKMAKNIGIWIQVLSVLSKASVTVCACIIAFSTDLIPRMVYNWVNDDKEALGYVDFTLSYMKIEHLDVPTNLNAANESSLEHLATNESYCRYVDFRNPPWHEKPYDRPVIYWQILTARLTFLVIYQNIIAGLQSLVIWFIPETPSYLKRRMKRENFLLREFSIQTDLKATQNANQSIANPQNSAQSEEDLKTTRDGNCSPELATSI